LHEVDVVRVDVQIVVVIVVVVVVVVIVVVVVVNLDACHDGDDNLGDAENDSHEIKHHSLRGTTGASRFNKTIFTESFKEIHFFFNLKTPHGFYFETKVF
jgi:hypothetical protein